MNILWMIVAYLFFFSRDFITIVCGAQTGKPQSTSIKNQLKYLLDTTQPSPKMGKLKKPPHDSEELVEKENPSTEQICVSMFDRLELPLLAAEGIEHARNNTWIKVEETRCSEHEKSSSDGTVSCWWCHWNTLFICGDFCRTAKGMTKKLNIKHFVYFIKNVLLCD